MGIEEDIKDIKSCLIEVSYQLERLLLYKEHKADNYKEPIDKGMKEAEPRKYKPLSKEWFDKVEEKIREKGE